MQVDDKQNQAGRVNFPPEMGISKVVNFAAGGFGCEWDLSWVFQKWAVLPEAWFLYPGMPTYRWFFEPR